MLIQEKLECAKASSDASATVHGWDDGGVGVRRNKRGDGANGTFQAEGTASAKI